MRCELLEGTGGGSSNTVYYSSKPRGVQSSRVDETRRDAQSNKLLGRRFSQSGLRRRRFQVVSLFGSENLCGEPTRRPMFRSARFSHEQNGARGKPVRRSRFLTFQSPQILL